MILRRLLDKGIHKGWFGRITSKSTHNINRQLYTQRAMTANRQDGIMDEEMWDRIERNAEKLAMLENVDFNGTFDSSSGTHSSPARRPELEDGVFEQLQGVRFDSFCSDLEDRDSDFGSLASPRSDKREEGGNRASFSGPGRAAFSPVKEGLREAKRAALGEQKSDVIDSRQSEEKENSSQRPYIKEEHGETNMFIRPDSHNIRRQISKASTNRSPLATVSAKLAKPVQQIRDLSSTRSHTAKSVENTYHSIQLSTQKPAEIPQDAVEGTAQLKQVKPIILSREQEHILHLALKGISLFYTGSAGTGKSVLLKSMIKALKQKHKPGQVVVTASTGLAACNIGGNTLHRFAGVGLGEGDVKSLLKKIRTNRKTLQRWKEVKVLVIDEVSMIDGHFFDKLNEIAQKIRRKACPFGGIQLIVCGDFFQLPPVVKKTAPDGTEILQPEEAMFSFESRAWKTTIEKTIILQEVFRQKGDQLFIEMLNEMRDGKVSDSTLKEFKSLSRGLESTDGIAPAELFATRKEVDRSNNLRLSKLSGNAQVFSAVDAGTLPSPQKQNLLSNFLAPQNLFLKKGAQVMCIKNFDETLVNGSLGQVIDFVDRDSYMKATDSSTSKESPENHVVDSTSDFVFDFAASKEDKKELTRAEKENLERKRSLAEEFNKGEPSKKYPLVKFLLPDGVNTRTVLVEPEQWTVEDEQSNVLVSRIQIPVILAWSLSIHKSQGQTLPKVKVDLRNVFENGQSYVALSRAVSRNGLQVLNFDKYKVRTNPKVTHFYKTLMSAEEASASSRGQSTLDVSKDAVGLSTSRYL